MFNREIPEEITAEDMMSDEFWRSFGIEPVHLDPNDEDSLKQFAERLETEVKKIRESEE